MRFSFRLVAPLLLGVTVVSLLFSYYQVRRDRHLQTAELSRRAGLLAESLDENIEHVLSSRQALQRLVDRFGNREHLVGVAIYDGQGTPLATSSALRAHFVSRPEIIRQAIAGNRALGTFLQANGTPLHMYAVPMHREDKVIGGFVIVQEAAYLEHQGAHLWHNLLLGIAVQICLITGITFLIVRWSIDRPLARTAQWVRAMRTGRTISPSHEPSDLFQPLTHEVTTLAESLLAARASALQEAELREAADSSWTAEKLAVSLRDKLKDSRLFVVANREPYMHSRREKSIETTVPASGLVTALEPVLCACDGTWVAHGSGNADHETVDERDCLRVPPEDARYTLRRVWLSKEEEEGYYFGFSNEGLWPLCHIAHTRPIFRADDWNAYRKVNAKFANSLIEEMVGIANPVVMVQDYHFALLPRLIKAHRPDARVAIFWHIPWPNPEAFSICPWQRDLLDGLLGADLVGFHIQLHCMNFLDTVDRALESRIDWEHFAVHRAAHVTNIRPFPISVVWPERAPEHVQPLHAQQSALLDNLGVEALFLGVGVDRVDYTKGILERFLGIERFLEKYTSYQGKFTFVQIGAPSRTHIKRYHDLLAAVEAEADRINWRFQSGKWKPIIFLKRHHNHKEIDRYYRAADMCLVTSLHDGMNLVAKEFVTARDDEEGVLILSPFTGACHELSDALIVNPYDTEQTANAIKSALEMDSRERKVRMRRMRRVVKDQNVYRWAGTLISHLCDASAEMPERDAGRMASAHGWIDNQATA